MPDWKSQALHVVWFVNGQINSKPEDLYQAAVGAAPLGSQMSQAAPPATGAIWNLNGQDTDYAYQLQVQLGRVDFVLTAKAPAAPPPNGVPLMPSFDQAFDRLITVGERVAAHLDGATRVAVVSEFQKPKPSLAEANGALSDVLGPGVVFPDATDVMFQLNRRKPIQSIAGAEMNRVIQWAVATIQTITFAVPQAGGGMLLPGLGGPMPTQGAQVKESFAASMRVDVNTHATAPTSYSSAQQNQLIREFCAEIKRLAQNGGPGALA